MLDRSRSQPVRAAVLAALLIVLFACGGPLGERGSEVVPSEPLAFDSGTGPAELIGVDLLEALEAEGTSTVRVAIDRGNASRVHSDPAFQLRVFLDSPEHDLVLYHSADQSWLVTPEFEVLQESVESSLDEERDEILFYVPLFHQEMSGLAQLAWNRGDLYQHATILEGLQFYGFEIGRAWFQSKQQKRQQKNEVYLAVSSADQIKKANNKGWPAGPGETPPDDGTNPPNNPGPLYKGWPLTFAGNTRYWEYSGASGFIKRAHIDTNGNGRIDAGEPHGYVGRCPYVVGINTQVMTPTSSTWTSEWQGKGQRIVHRFKEFTQPDGSKQYKVESTHETKQPDGSWKATTVPPASQNPITNDPYQQPGSVPGNGSFGL